MSLPPAANQKSNSFEGNERSASCNAITAVQTNQQTSRMQTLCFNYYATETRCCRFCQSKNFNGVQTHWVQACKCLGITKWVHRSCLFHWISFKQKGNKNMKVFCSICGCEFIIPKPNITAAAFFLNHLNYTYNRIWPFLMNGIVAGSLYWSASAYGAFILIQMHGVKHGVKILKNMSYLTWLTLPLIPLTFGIARVSEFKYSFPYRINPKWTWPFLTLKRNVLSNQDGVHLSTRYFSNHIAITELVCGSLIMPTVSITIGNYIYGLIGNGVIRAGFGGITYLIGERFAHIYLRYKQKWLESLRQLLEYTEQNLRRYCDFANSYDEVIHLNESQVQPFESFELVRRYLRTEFGIENLDETADDDIETQQMYLESLRRLCLESNSNHEMYLMNGDDYEPAAEQANQS